VLIGVVAVLIVVEACGPAAVRMVTVSLAGRVIVSVLRGWLRVPAAGRAGGCFASLNE
jgi:hypothetical protein